METGKDYGDDRGADRREFVSTGLKLALVSGFAGAGLLAACSGKKEEGEDKEVSPPEDLMQEHGLLNRVLLIYDACKIHLQENEKFAMNAIVRAAGIIREFVEDYHEKQEENYLFPRFEKALVLTDLVKTLRQQHDAGRAITAQLLQLPVTGTLNDAERARTIQLLTDFNVMYRPHEAREDTVLFPAFRKIVSKHEYDALGEEFEKNEHKRFGEDGFDTMVYKVSEIEKQLGIYDLTQFTR